MLRAQGTPSSIAAVSVSSCLEPQLIEEPAELARICSAAAASGVVALDTESDSLHSYFHKVCLIQMSFAGRHVVLDPLALDREALQPLVGLLADRGVEKLFHGADYDLRVLDRDLGARVVRLRDTQVAAQLLGEGQTGLAALVGREVGTVLEKRYQRADWGQRPLSRELLAYAVGDTAFLTVLRDRFGDRLTRLGRMGWWDEECAALEGVRWEAPAPDPLAFERIKGAGRLAGAARDRLAALHAWREREAAAADVPPFRILHSDALLALAAGPPSDLTALAGVRGVGRATVRRFGREILRVIAQAPPAPPRNARPRRTEDRERERRLRQTQALRNVAAGELSLEPGLLAARAALELVVDRRPRSEGELMACLGRCWRAAVLAPALLPLVKEWEGGAPVHAQPA